jgi:hypothetical protein
MFSVITMSIVRQATNDGFGDRPNVAFFVRTAWILVVRWDGVPHNKKHSALAGCMDVRFVPVMVAGSI